MRRRKLLLISCLLIFVSVILSVYFCNRAIVNAAKGKLYTDANEVPYHKVGLLLGTSRELTNGRLNPYYAYRIQAAIKLLDAHKIKYLVISGDNGHVAYNEPEMMRQDLMKAGIDSATIFLDHAGFRTFDSIKRLKEIFSQDSVVIISQQFHNERAIYIANHEGISAVGFNATDVGVRTGLTTQMREKLARVKVFVDFIFGTKPKYLGNKIIIPS